jgi:hypothetical protein
VERLIYLNHEGGKYEARLQREIELPFMPTKDIELFLDGEIENPHGIDHPLRIKLVLIRWFGKNDEFTAVANGINVDSFGNDPKERKWHKIVVDHLNSGWDWLYKPEGWRFEDTEE